MFDGLPSLDRLRVFCAVVRSGSITAGAERLHVTKAAVSHAVKLLQEETGESLFVHRGRTLAVTEAGRSLFETVEPFLLTLSDRYAGSARGQGPIALVRIAAPPLFAARYLMPAIAAFMKRHPRVRFHVQQTASTTPLRQLEDDHVDLCVADSLDVMFGQRSYFDVRELLTDPELVVCSRRYWRARFGGEPTYEQLVDSEYISYHPQGAELCSWLQTLFGRSPKTLSPVLVVDRADAVLFAVLQDLGLGLVPMSILGRRARNVTTTIGGRKGVFHNKMVIARLKGKKESAAQALFVEHLVRAVPAAP